MFRHGDEACFGERLVAQRAVEGSEALSHGPLKLG